jgi:3-methyl-2-oxobutanoate hydroxymethyltransferase
MMALHTAAVRRGTAKLLIADLPFPAHRQGVAEAMRAVDQLMKAGANAVKLEGARGHLDIVEHIVDSGVPVMGHLGLMPQSVNSVGGYRVQGRAEAEADRLRTEARQLQDAGASSLVLELVPAALAAEITESLSIPTIGIGSGPSCSGQVLVFHDALGLNPGFKPSFLRLFSQGADHLADGLAAYANAVHGREFPNQSEGF